MGERTCPAFLNSLPVREELDIQGVTYNDALNDSTQREATLLPLRVTLPDKSVIELWAKVLPLQEGMTDSQLTYQILEEDLIFHEKEEVFQKKGYMNAVLYTDKEVQNTKKRPLMVSLNSIYLLLLLEVHLFQ